MPHQDSFQQKLTQLMQAIDALDNVMAQQCEEKSKADQKVDLAKYKLDHIIAQLETLQKSEAA